MSKSTKAQMLTAALNRRTGFLLSLSPLEKDELKAAAGDKPLSAWIRDVALAAARTKQEQE